MAISLRTAESEVLHYRLRQVAGGFLFQNIALPAYVTVLAECLRYLATQDGAAFVGLLLPLGKRLSGATPDSQASHVLDSKA
jgi:hypothetical protein